LKLDLTIDFDKSARLAHLSSLDPDLSQVASANTDEQTSRHADRLLMAG
jgi:hypothetical protein